MSRERFLLAVGKDNRNTWINVWVDKDGNVDFHRLNNGDELTPTGLVGERVLPTPSADELVDPLAA